MNFKRRWPQGSLQLATSNQEDELPLQLIWEIILICCLDPVIIIQVLALFEGGNFVLRTDKGCLKLPDWEMELKIMMQFCLVIPITWD